MKLLNNALKNHPKNFLCNVHLLLRMMFYSEDISAPFVSSELTYDAEFHQFLRSQEGMLPSKAVADIKGLNQQQVR